MVADLTGERSAADAGITPEQFGPWRFCKEADLTRVFGENKTSLKLAAMCDVGLITPDEIPHQRDTLINMIRVATTCEQIDDAIAIANAAVAKGHEAAIMLVSISHEEMASIEACLGKIGGTCSAQVVYIADTRGALYNEQVEMLTKLFKSKCPGRVVGFCGSNNLQMSVSNTVMAVVEGADMVDGSIMGLGRGAGGTPTENLMCFLKNPKYKLRPVLVALQNHVQPLCAADDTFFGVGVTGCPSLPYLVAGTRNDDPSDSLAWCNAGKKHDGVGFLDFVRSKAKQFPSVRNTKTPPRSGYFSRQRLRTVLFCDNWLCLSAFGVMIISAVLLREGCCTCDHNSVNLPRCCFYLPTRVLTCCLLCSSVCCWIVAAPEATGGPERTRPASSRRLICC